GDYTGAIFYLNKVLTLNPNNIRALVDKGLSLDSLWNHTGAMIYYEKMLSSPSRQHTAPHLSTLAG
ncbi:MAG: hypothetical protein WAM14_06600, partial [Candidatus Nitrosopolaris sp.]